MNKFAIVFPGQGSQALGMLQSMATEVVIQETFAQASTILGYDLWHLIQQGPEEKLNQTEYTQPALLVSSIALWRLWQAHHYPLPAIVAGHSLGEYSALVCAQALDFADAVRLVAERGRLMQAACSDGAMAAIIGLESSLITKLCLDTSSGNESAAPANFNAQGQVVIAGTVKTVEQVMQSAKAQGAKLVKRLSVSVPAHCALMRPAAEGLAKHLATIEIKSPVIPVLNNVDVHMAQSAKMIKEALLRQLYSPVRWVETIQAMATKDITSIIECGPGKVLTGLHKRIEPVIATWPYYDRLTLEQAKVNIEGE